MTTYNNGSGLVPRLPDRVVDTLIDSAGVSCCAPGRGITVRDQTAAVEQLVHDACEELLARLPSSPNATAQAAELAFYKEAHHVASGKLVSVWDGIMEAVEKYGGQPCEGEPLDRLNELLARLSAQGTARPEVQEG